MRNFYRNLIYNKKGITLISLVITIIILLILSGITINLVLTENGIFSRAQKSAEIHEKGVAREKLELKLVDMQIEKVTNSRNFNKDDSDYLTEQLRKESFIVNENTVEVDGWLFLIDRSVPKIIGELEKFETNDKIQIDIQKKVETNYSYSTITIKITSDVELKSIIFDGKEIKDLFDENGEYSEVVTENKTYLVYAVDINDKQNRNTIEVTEIIGDMEIWNKADLIKFRNMVNNGRTFEGDTIKLMADIDLNPNQYTISEEGTVIFLEDAEHWIPIGNYGIDENLVFNGTFEGNSHTISGLYINGASTAGQGLFGKNQGTIQNLKLKNANINTSSNNTGILVGYNDKTGIISNIETRGNITSTNDRTGGIVGDNYGEITIVTNNVIVSGSSYVGGIAGYNTGGNITKSRNYGTITSSVKYTGGITGVNHENSSIEECYNVANIDSTGYFVGGISGTSQYSSSILNCYNTGIILCTGKNASSGNTAVGGISGGNRYTSTIQYCYNTGNVTGYYTYVGGIVAFNGADGEGTQIVNNVFNTGIITKSSTTASSNIGKSSNDYVGYLIGRYGSLTGQYENTNQTTMSSWSIETITTNLSNKFTNDIQNEDKTWKYNNGYPVLIWQTNP